MEEGFVTYFIILGTALLGVMVAVFFAYIFYYEKKSLKQKNKFQQMESEKQKEIFKATLNAQESERRRISKNLHDGIGPYLTALRGKNEYFGELQIRDKEFAEQLKEGNKLIDTAAESIREICEDLTPQLLITFDIYDALRVFSEYLSSPSLALDFVAELNQRLIFSEAESTNIFRVYQEVLNNIFKYAGATEVKVRCLANAGAFELKIKHDGKIFTNQEAARQLEKVNSLGLKNIYARLEIINGSINYFAENGIAHTTISIKK